MLKAYSYASHLVGPHYTYEIVKEHCYSDYFLIKWELRGVWGRGKYHYLKLNYIIASQKS